MATTNNKCKNCGCDDKFMPSPAPCPTPQGCPDPQPCSEVIDAQCVIYTGADIECGEDLVVEEGTSVTNAIINVIDYFCNNTPVASCPPKVSIVRNQNGSLTATASGGTGSYNFQWEFASAVNGIQNMFGNPTSQSNTLTTSTYNFSRNASAGIGPALLLAGYAMYIGLAKVIATDGAGCVAKDTYLVIDMVAT